MLNQTGGKGEKTLFVVYPEDRSSGWCQKGSTLPRAWQGMSFHKHTQHHGDPNQVWGFETRSRRAGWREREGGTQGTAGAQALQERCAKACPQPGPALEGSRQLHMEQGEAARPEGDPGRAWRRWGLHENTPAAEQIATTGSHTISLTSPFALGEKIHFSLKIPPSHLPSELSAGTVTWHQCDPLSHWRKSCSPPTQCTSSRGVSWGSCACCPKLLCVLRISASELPALGLHAFSPSSPHCQWRCPSHTSKFLGAFSALPPSSPTCQSCH